MKQLLLKTALVTAGIVAGLALSPTTVQAAVNYFNTTKIVSGYGSATCPDGWKLTGGGVESIRPDYFGSSSSTEYELTGSWPYGTRTWKATGTKVVGSYSNASGWSFNTSGYAPRVHAVCAS